jgi:hypothetical protein
MNAQDVCDALRRYLSESERRPTRNRYQNRHFLEHLIGLARWRSGATQKHVGTGGGFS